MESFLIEYLTRELNVTEIPTSVLKMVVKSVEKHGWTYITHSKDYIRNSIQLSQLRLNKSVA